MKKEINVWPSLKEEAITNLVLLICHFYKTYFFKFTSGDIDQLFRSINRVVFNLETHQTEPSSAQRAAIFKRYPEIFPRKRG